MGDLSDDALLMLKIMIANGGVMMKDDVDREFMRVKAMTPGDRARWERRVEPLVRENIERHKRGELP